MRRETSSEYTSMTDRVKPSTGATNGTVNGSAAKEEKAGDSAAAAAAGPHEAGVTQLVMAVAGIYGSLYATTTGSPLDFLVVLFYCSPSHDGALTTFLLAIQPHLGLSPREAHDDPLRTRRVP